MSHPATIRTKFASAEDAAKVYGVSFQRVEELRRLLDKVKSQATERRSTKARADNARPKRASKARSSASRKSNSRRSTRRAA